MDDLISRQAAIDALVKWTHLTWEHLKIIYPMLNVLEELPSAERRGRWEAIDRDCRGYAITYECSSCKQLITLPYPMKWMDYDYCPNCGARMEASE